MESNESVELKRQVQLLVSSFSSSSLAGPEAGSSLSQQYAGQATDATAVHISTPLLPWDQLTKTTFEHALQSGMGCCSKPVCSTHSMHNQLGKLHSQLNNQENTTAYGTQTTAHGHAASQNQCSNAKIPSAKGLSFAPRKPLQQLSTNCTGQQQQCPATMIKAPACTTGTTTQHNLPSHKTKPRKGFLQATQEPQHQELLSEPPLQQALRRGVTRAVTCQPDQQAFTKPDGPAIHTTSSLAHQDLYGPQPLLPILGADPAAASYPRSAASVWMLANTNGSVDMSPAESSSYHTASDGECVSTRGSNDEHYGQDCRSKTTANSVVAHHSHVKATQPGMHQLAASAHNTMPPFGVAEPTPEAASCKPNGSSRTASHQSTPIQPANHRSDSMFQPLTDHKHHLSACRSTVIAHAATAQPSSTSAACDIPASATSASSSGATYQSSPARLDSIIAHNQAGVQAAVPSVAATKPTVATAGAPCTGIAVARPLAAPYSSCVSYTPAPDAKATAAPVLQGAADSSNGRGASTGSKHTGGQHQSAQHWQQRQHGIQLGRQGAPTINQSILDPFTSRQSQTSSSSSTGWGRQQSQQVQVSACGHNKDPQISAATKTGSGSGRRCSAAAAVASLAASALARWRPGFAGTTTTTHPMAAAAVAAGAKPAAGLNKEHELANDVQHYQAQDTWLLGASSAAVKQDPQLSSFHAATVAEFLQSGAAQPAAFSEQQHHKHQAAAAQSMGLRTGADVVPDSSCGSCLDALHPVLAAASDNQASNQPDTLCKHSLSHHQLSAMPALLRDVNNNEQQRTAAAAMTTGEVTATASWPAHHAAQQQQQPQRVQRDLKAALAYVQHSYVHSNSSHDMTSKPAAVQAAAAARALQMLQMQKQTEAAASTSCSSAATAASSIVSRHELHAAQALKRLRMQQDKKMLAGSTYGGSTAVVGAAKQVSMAPDATAESNATNHDHMQSLFSSTSQHLPMSTMATDTATAQPTKDADLPGLQVPPHLLQQLHLQLTKLMQEHAGIINSSGSNSSYSVHAQVPAAARVHSRPLSAGTASADLAAGTGSAVHSTASRGLISATADQGASSASAGSAAVSAASSVSDSLIDTAQSSLSYKLPGHLLTRTPYVGLHRSDLDYITQGVHYYHGGPNCADVWFIKQERRLSERTRRGARKMLVWDKAQQNTKAKHVSDLYTLD